VIRSDDKKLVSTLTAEDLSKSIIDLQKQLFEQRMSICFQKTTNTSVLRVLRKQIARRKFQLAQVQRVEVV
jgi:ribosomal protein L29